ncbi:MAG TPA: DUF58 domain-containing protein [Candidatus Polarisedimenticolia bacterium]|nr:DUF58 domain-containing protein [Candidatus Polarisedimenticolia bacterium]
MTSGDRLRPDPARSAAHPEGRFPYGFASRSIVLLVAGFAWLGPAWWNPRFLYAMLGWDLFVLAFWAWDLATVTAPASLSVTRSWPHTLALGSPGSVELSLSNGGAGWIRAQLGDTPPAALGVESGDVTLEVPPGATASASYPIAPRRRGDQDLGVVYLRYRGRLGMAERRARADLPQRVRIYPDLEQSRRLTSYLIRVRQVDLEKRLRRQRGRGREFESLREYRTGDPWRDVCWTATARRGKMITRQYQVERNQHVWIVLDTGRLLRARVDGLTKLDHAVSAALSLAQVALFSGDRVGLLAYGRSIEHRLRPARGSAHVRTLLETLAVVQPEASEADHEGAAAGLMALQRQRCLIVWLTDLAETAAIPEVIESAARLSSRHLVLFVLIGQPDLIRLAAHAPESVSGMYRYAAAMEMIDRRERLLGSLRARGALAMESLPGGLTATLVTRYLEIKERNLL